MVIQASFHVNTFNSLGDGHTCITTSAQKHFQKNQVCASLWPAHTWFKNTFLLYGMFYNLIRYSSV